MASFFGSLDTFYKGNMTFVLIALAAIIALGVWKRIKVLWITGAALLVLFLVSGYLAGTKTA